VVPVVAARLPGRGLWLTPRRDIVDQAVQKRLFARAARRPVVAPPELADRVEALLVRHCIEALGLARRSGRAVAGFEKVREAVRAGKAGLLLVALDGAPGGRQKVRALGRGVPLAAVLTGSELGAAFAREQMVYASVGAGALAARILADAHKIAGFRTEAVVDRGIERVSAKPAHLDGGNVAI